MVAIPTRLLTVEEFLAWAETQPGRYELQDGRIIAMAPERAGHVRTKFRVQKALDQAIRQAGSPCEVFAEGLSVRVSASRVYEPDAIVQCGASQPDEATEAVAPVIVVEVLSPSTAGRDVGPKLEGYFAVESVMHYLIIAPEQRTIIHHRRVGAVIQSAIAGSGLLHLDPPGLDLDVEACFPPP
jgi:Uma2 family endonuclease